MNKEKDYMKTLRWLSPVLALLALVVVGVALVTRECEYLW